MPGTAPDPTRAGGPTLTRAGLLRRAGLGLAAVAVAGVGALGYRAYDQGVFEAGEGPAYEPWGRWRDGAGLESLVAAAILAPSPHNAQAWLFGLGPGRVDLYADRARSTGALDPFRREMHVGLGAALENLMLAAGAAGWSPRVQLMPAGLGSTHVARVHLAPSAAAAPPLHARIPHRHTNRYPFAEGRPLPPSALAAMAGLADPAGPVRLAWFVGAADRARIGRLLVDATAAIVEDRDQRAMDHAWFRQDWDEIQRQRDGITVDAAGLPELTVALAKLLPAQSERATGESWLEATRDRHTATAAAYGMVIARDASDPRQRLLGGRLLQRVHLWATGEGIAVHHMNQLTERADREAQLGAEPRFGAALRALVPSGWQPLATFRAGHPTRTPPPSPRRPVSAVVVA